MKLVQNLEKLERPIIFDGLTSKMCYPTDIDAVIELYNKYLIITEVKELGKDITVGQSLTTTRIIDAWNSDKNKLGMVVFTQHNPEDTEILLKNTIVKKVYMNGVWRDMSKKNITYKKFLQIFGETYNIEHLKFNKPNFKHLINTL